MEMFRVGWSGIGSIKEVRELKTKDGKTWSHGIKLEVMGGTYELQTQDAQLAAQCKVNTLMKVGGGFDQYQGNLKLRLEKVEVYKS